MTVGDLASVKMANMRAAVCGADVSWIPLNGNGKTLPQELAATGHHIMIPHKALPEWLDRRLTLAA